MSTRVIGWLRRFTCGGTLITPSRMTVLMTPQVESGLLHGEDSQTNRGLTTPRIGLAQVDKSGSCRAETANATGCLWQEWFKTSESGVTRTTHLGPKDFTCPSTNKPIVFGLLPSPQTELSTVVHDI